MSSYNFASITGRPISFLLVYSLLVSSCDSYVIWLYPSDNDTGLTFNYIDTVYFTWLSSISGPWLNLWCAPNHTSPQSSTFAYHEQVSTNGTNPQSFPYSEYNSKGICHMQLENFAEDDFANTPTFDLKSDDAAKPQTWGLSAFKQFGGGNIASATVAISSTTTRSTAAETTPASSFQGSSATSASVTSRVPTTTSPTASPSQTSPPPLPPSNGLSTAAKAGIGIGSIFCALALIIALLLVRNARRSRRTGAKLSFFDLFRPQRLPPDHEDALPNQNTVPDSLVVGPQEVNGIARPSELYGMPRSELPWTPKGIELDAAERN